MLVLFFSIELGSGGVHQSGKGSITGRYRVAGWSLIYGVSAVCGVNLPRGSGTPTPISFPRPRLWSVIDSVIRAVAVTPLALINQES